MKQVLLFLIVSIGMVTAVTAQTVSDPVPKKVETMYNKGLKYLAKQQVNGSWGTSAGPTGLAVLAILAHGDDPNFGPYKDIVRNGVRHILNIQAQNSDGYIGSSMYHHGFATLCLAEAYGHLDNDFLNRGGGKKYHLGKSLDKAVKVLLSSQSRNSRGAWRYSPQSNDADTTISGACLVALLAARNAGLEIPDTAINRALEYYKSCQCSDGGFGYTRRDSSNAPRTAIGTLVHALAKRKDSATYKQAFKYLDSQKNSGGSSYYYYYLYYGSQAFFHSTPKSWDAFNNANIKLLAQSQNEDGSWSGPHGSVFSTSAALLSLALNFRFLPIYER